jgi:transaldolase
MANKLDQLKAMTDVVADTGDIEAIKEFKPMDATTNPSLLLKAAALPMYSRLLLQAQAFAADCDGPKQEKLDACCDRLSVLIGKEILNIVPGRVSTEVDARLSFDCDAMIERGRGLIAQYEELGFGKERILIKLASTWEGINAARVLEKEGINCNLTLLFSFEQALACADAGVFLISPFVGRILDWYKNATGELYVAATDPGVLSVQKIFNHYKQHGFETVVMGASFRNTGEIEALAGCDRLTISPALMAELTADEGELSQVLNKDQPEPAGAHMVFNEQAFRWVLNESAMATEKLAEGIRAFTADTLKLEQQLLQ